MHGESASADKEAAEKYCIKFQGTEGYLPQQIFNCDETGLFWKRMPNHTYITKDEKSVFGRGQKSLSDTVDFYLAEAGEQGDTPEIMDEILTTARDLELEVNEDDIEELIMGHEDKLTTEEL
ncbi:tigger transposable element-derived protein 1-like protein [Trichonephila clavipes]|nr:tigger transposable element-derived protein 1-like protein [Trichonephila clavipes]